MHTEWTGEGLIIKVGRFREIDCWVRFFSPNQGIVTALAFGGSRSRRRFCGCLDALNSVLFKVRFFPAKGRHVLEEATLLRGFPRLRRDSTRAGLAANCLHFIQALRISAEEAPVIHGLLMETLGVLDQAEHIAPVFAQLFRAKICFSLGYTPELAICSICGQTIFGSQEQSAINDNQDGYGEGKFSPRLGATLAMDIGQVQCLQCSPRNGDHLQIGLETQSILQGLLISRPQQWAVLAMSPDTRGELFQVVDSYVRRHLGLRWQNGRFVSE